MKKMNKRGTFYVMLVCIFVFIFIIVAYIQLDKYFKFNKDDATKSIGEKQGHIMSAIKEGERIHVYARSSLERARQESLKTYACGEDFLGGKKIGKEPCQNTFVNEITSYFLIELSKYPKETLSDMFDPPVVDAANKKAIFSGEKIIPITEGELAGVTGEGFTAAKGSFSGTVTGWPVGTSPVITSYFGRRNLGGQPGCINHGGIDFRGALGDAVFAIMEGEARFVEAGKDSYVEVDSGQVVLNYRHVRPAGRVSPNGAIVKVNVGEQIANIGPYSVPHLHLEARVKSITSQAANQAWPGKTGVCSSNIPLTYAVTTGKGNAYLDPVCFFDRAFIDSVPRGSVTAKSDPYEACHAYEQTFGLSKILGANAGTAAVGSASASGGVGATTSTATGTTSTSTTQTDSDTNNVGITASALSNNPAESTNPDIRLTYENLQNEGLIELVNEVAQKHSLPPSLLFAIITQESKGDKNAVSPTGAAGIAQFTSGTARANQYKPYFTQITPCCTESEALARVCAQSQVTKCNPANDDRFDPRKSIEAKGLLLSDSSKRYQGMDQQVAFILIDYNAGAGAAAQIRSKVSANPTWDEIRNVIANDITINYGSGVDPAKKRGEVIGYVERITRDYIGEWGGATLAGSSFTREQTGYYEMKLILEVDTTNRLADAIDSIREGIINCEDQECVDALLSNVQGMHGVIITPEDLSSTSGCLAQGVRAQAHLALQVEHCKSSPDDVCLCDVTGAFDAEYEVGSDSIQIKKYDGKDVNVEPFSSLGRGYVGEGHAHEKVKLYDGQSIQQERDSYVIDTKQNGDIEINRLILPDTKINTLYKKEVDGGLSLARQESTPENACILPESFKPAPYCIRASDNSVPPIVFYLDRRLDTKPEIEIKQFEGDTVMLSNLVRVIYFAEEKHPYAKIRYQVPGQVAGQEEFRETYFRTVEGGGFSFLSLFSSSFPIGFGAFTYQNRLRVINELGLPADPITGSVMAPLPPHNNLKHSYEIIVRAQPGEEATLTIYDEYLNEAGSFPIDLSLKKEESGIVLPFDLLTGLVGGILP